MSNTWFFDGEGNMVTSSFEENLKNLQITKKLSTVPTNMEFIIEEILADEDTKRFLFSLGCYEGESITVLSHNYSTFIVVIKNGKYSIDRDLANNIYVKLK